MTAANAAPVPTPQPIPEAELQAMLEVANQATFGTLASMSALRDDLPRVVRRLMAVERELRIFVTKDRLRDTQDQMLRLQSAIDEALRLGHVKPKLAFLEHYSLSKVEAQLKGELAELEATEDSPCSPTSSQRSS